MTINVWHIVAALTVGLVLIGLGKFIFGLGVIVLLGVPLVMLALHVTKSTTENKWRYP